MLPDGGFVRAEQAGAVPVSVQQFYLDHPPQMRATERGKGPRLETAGAVPEAEVKQQERVLWALLLIAETGHITATHPSGGDVGGSGLHGTSHHVQPSFIRKVGS